MVNHLCITGLACSGRVVADSKTRRTFTDSFTDTWPPLLRNLLEFCHLEVEPAVGIEPTTHGLQNRCSTAELSWQDALNILRLAGSPVKLWRGATRNGIKVREQGLPIRCPRPPSRGQHRV